MEKKLIADTQKEGGSRRIKQEKESAGQTNWGRLTDRDCRQ